MTWELLNYPKVSESVIKSISAVWLNVDSRIMQTTHTQSVHKNFQDLRLEPKRTKN